jgi:hypothetical protein
MPCISDNDPIFLKQVQLLVPATTYCFSVLSLLRVSLLRFNVSAIICFGVDAIHWPRAMSVKYHLAEGPRGQEKHIPVN